MIKIKNNKLIAIAIVFMLLLTTCILLGFTYNNKLTASAENTIYIDSEYSEVQTFEVLQYDPPIVTYDQAMGRFRVEKPKALVDLQPTHFRMFIQAWQGSQSKTYDLAWTGDYYNLDFLAWYTETFGSDNGFYCFRRDIKFYTLSNGQYATSLSTEKFVLDTFRPIIMNFSNSTQVNITDNDNLDSYGNFVNAYEIIIRNEIGVLYNEVITGKSFDLVNYPLEAGDYAILLRPHSKFWSEEVSEIIYCNGNNLYFRLSSLATPIISINKFNVLSWQAITGSNGYVIAVEDKLYTTNETTFDLMTVSQNLDYNTPYSVKVKALGNIAKQSNITMLNASNMYQPLVCINYDVDGDITQMLTPFGSIITPPTIQISGLVLEGWYYDKAFIKKVSEGDKADGNMTLYARLVEPQDIEQSVWDRFKGLFITLICVGVVIVAFGVLYPILKKRR